MKTVAMVKKTPLGLELWRVQKDDEHDGVQIDFTIPGYLEFCALSWSITPDPGSKALAAYVTKKITANEKAGFSKVTAAKFDAAVERRAKQTFDEPEYVQSAAAEKRTNELIRYLKKNPDGTVRFIHDSGRGLKWWLMDFAGEHMTKIEHMGPADSQPVTCWLYFSGDIEDSRALSDIETEHQMNEIAARVRAGYRHVTERQFARALAKHARR